MNAIIKRRVLEEANIIVNTETTLRNLARRLGISKSTIHKDMQIRLIKIDQNLYHKVQKVFKKHLEIRYYRWRKNKTKIQKYNMKKWRIMVE